MQTRALSITLYLLAPTRVTCHTDPFSVVRHGIGGDVEIVDSGVHRLRQEPSRSRVGVIFHYFRKRAGEDGWTVWEFWGGGGVFSSVVMAAWLGLEQ